MNLNERIKSLFLSMINCPEKIENVNKYKIVYDNGVHIQLSNDEACDNKSLQLESCDIYKEWHLILHSLDITKHITFEIHTPYKIYYVPDFTDRLEYATVLNILDRNLALFEQRKLNEYELYFSDAIKESNSKGTC